MMDYLLETRQSLIDNFQTSMKAIRLLMRYSMAELAEYIGVTRQTINNLETRRSQMSSTQFLALAAVVDNYSFMHGGMPQAIAAILYPNGMGTSKCGDALFCDFSLLRRWFLLFEGADVEMTPVSGCMDTVQLQQLVSNYKIFLDDTALLSEKLEGLLYGLADCLTAEDAKLIVPLRAVEQIQQQMHVQNVACVQRAVKTLRLLNWMQQKKLVQFRGEPSDADLHDTILSVFLKFRGTHRLCLITQDHIFAAKVLRLNEINEQDGFPVTVGYIDSSGRLALFDSEPVEENAPVPVDTDIAPEPDTWMENGEEHSTSWADL